jgi:hypothetical protein
MELYIGDVFVNSWSSDDDPTVSPIIGPFNKLKVYQDNIDKLLEDFIAKETPFFSDNSDFTDENQDGVPGEDANGSESIVDGENNDTKVEGELNTPSDEVQQENIVTTPVALPEDVEIERIIAVIGNENISVDEKLNTILKSSIFAFSILAGKLIDYRDHMHRDQGTMEIATGAYKNQDLFREIMNVLNNTNDDIYRTAFAIINLTFKTYKGEEEAFNFYSLARYDWGWASKKDSDTFGM